MEYGDLARKYQQSTFGAHFVEVGVDMGTKALFPAQAGLTPLRPWREALAEAVAAPVDDGPIPSTP